jgi:YHS domain-containing protein
MDEVATESDVYCACLQAVGDCSKEIHMYTLVDSKAAFIQKPPGTLIGKAGWSDDSNGILERDKTQSDRLHEPEHCMNTIDPMSGRDIKNATTHPSLIDGNLTMYFESEKTKKAFLKMPINHPNLHLPFPATDYDDRGG